MILQINNLQIRKDKYDLNIKNLALKKNERLILQVSSKSDKTIIREIFNSQPAKNTDILSGNLFIGDRDILQPLSGIQNSQSDQLIWIPQNPTDFFHPLYTPLKQFKQILRKKWSLSPAETSKKALQALFDLGLDDYWLNSLPVNIPQRVLVHFNWIVALTLKPLLIVAEEPWENFDPLVRKKLIPAISKILDENGTALLILTQNPVAYIDLVGQSYNLKENHLTAIHYRKNQDTPSLQNKSEHRKDTIINFSDVTTKKLQKINLELKEGQSTLIVTGNPPAAKDLFKAAAGLLKPSKGTVTRNIRPGECFYYRPEPFMPNMILLHSLLKYSQYLGSKLNVDELYKFFHSTMQKLGFADPKTTLLSFPAEITREEELMLCLILAGLTKPKLLLLEDTFTGVKMPLSDPITGLIKNIRATGEIAIMAHTCLLPQNFHFIDQVAFLYKDSILEIGPYSGIVTNPYHPYTECLLADVPTSANSLLEYDSTSNGCPFRPHCPKALPTCGWTGRDLQRLLFSLQYDDQTPKEIKDSIIAIGNNEVKGLNLELSLGYETNLSWQDLIIAIEKLMETYKPAMAEACLGLQYQKGLIVASFPPVLAPQEIKMKEGHRVSCLLY